MDNIRFILVMAMLMISYMLWESWQIDYGPKPQAFISDKPTVASSDTGTAADQTQQGSPQSGSNKTAVAAPTDNIITVKTDVISLEIDTQGGTLRNLDLLQYPQEKENTVVNKAYALIGLDAPEKDVSPIRLFDSRSENLYLAQSGLIANANSAAAPDHKSVFTAAKTQYTLEEGQDQITVPLTWTNQQGLTITKTYTFKRGSFAVSLEQKVSNQSNQNWSGKQYNQLVRTLYSDKNNNNFIRTFAGGVVYTEKEKFQKIKFEDMDDDKYDAKSTESTSKGGWSGMIQHYFAAAWIPPADQDTLFYTKDLKDSRFQVGSISPDLNVAANSEGTFTSQLYAGPKIQPVLEALAPGLELTVDYSWLTPIAKGIYWLLNKIYGFVGNWGVAILGVTFFIKALFFKLSKASFQSMAKMRKIQPKLKDLQERYADDRQKFNTEMMAMYKKEKVNPLGGCLPIMVQIPVFISLYWVLIETVELRQADFALWIQDLSAQDPFYLLPILYGITMKIQQGLNPAPIDPLQAQVMKMFPIVFTVFFLFFPSGLVLYWICNNSLSIIQQWYITKHVLEEDAHHH